MIQPYSQNSQNSMKIHQKNQKEFRDRSHEEIPYWWTVVIHYCGFTTSTTCIGYIILDLALVHNTIWKYVNQNTHTTTLINDRFCAFHSHILRTIVRNELMNSWNISNICHDINTVVSVHNHSTNTLILHYNKLVQQI